MPGSCRIHSASDAGPGKTAIIGLFVGVFVGCIAENLPPGSLLLTISGFPVVLLGLTFLVVAQEEKFWGAVIGHRLRRHCPVYKAS